MYFLRRSCYISTCKWVYQQFLNATMVSGHITSSLLYNRLWPFELLAYNYLLYIWSQELKALENSLKSSDIFYWVSYLRMNNTTSCLLYGISPMCDSPSNISSLPILPLSQKSKIPKASSKLKSYFKISYYFDCSNSSSKESICLKASTSCNSSF